MTAHTSPSKPAAEESPEEGHTFRFSIDIRSSSKVVGDPEYHDAEDFYGVPLVFEVRAWSMDAALRKALDLPFEVRMASAIEQERLDDETDPS